MVINYAYLLKIVLLNAKFYCKHMKHAADVVVTFSYSYCHADQGEQTKPTT